MVARAIAQLRGVKPIFGVVLSCAILHAELGERFVAARLVLRVIRSLAHIAHHTMAVLLSYRLGLSTKYPRFVQSVVHALFFVSMQGVQFILFVKALFQISSSR